MVLFRHEMKRNSTSLIIWTSALCFMMAVTVLLFKMMESQLSEMTEMLGDMGSLSSAYGMDSLDIGNFTNYFALECGEMIGLGGALFASLISVGALAKEEKEHTAEFLLTHPISRTRTVLVKLLSVITSIVILNAAVIIVSLGCARIIGEEFAFKEIFLLFLSYFIVQCEIAFVSFALSAFITRGTAGISIGLVLLTYFLNLASNITDKVAFLKYFTPFAYSDGASIISSGSLEVKYLLAALAVSAVAICAAFLKYNKKDIR